MKNECTKHADCDCLRHTAVAAINDYAKSFQLDQYRMAIMLGVNTVTVNRLLNNAPLPTSTGGYYLSLDLVLRELRKCYPDMKIELDLGLPSKPDELAFK